MAEEQKTETENGGALTVGELRKMITDTVQSIVGTGSKSSDDKPTEKEDDRAPSGSVAAMVAREVQKIREREAREKRDSDIDTKLAELAGKVNQETPPVERRRVHKLMGWGD